LICLTASSTVKGLWTVGHLLLDAVKFHDADAPHLRDFLDFRYRLMEMPIVWLIAHTLIYLWGTSRVAKT
jgi:hypothetical protein